MVGGIGKYIGVNAINFIVNKLQVTSFLISMLEGLPADCPSQAKPESNNRFD